MNVREMSFKCVMCISCLHLLELKDSVIAAKVSCSLELEAEWTHTPPFFHVKHRVSHVCSVTVLQCNVNTTWEAT